MSFQDNCSSKCNIVGASGRSGHGHGQWAQGGVAGQHQQGRVVILRCQWHWQHQVRNCAEVTFEIVSEQWLLTLFIPELGFNFLRALGPRAPSRHSSTARAPPSAGSSSSWLARDTGCPWSKGGLSQVGSQFYSFRPMLKKTLSSPGSYACRSAGTLTISKVWFELDLF